MNKIEQISVFNHKSIVYFTFRQAKLTNCSVFFTKKINENNPIVRKPQKFVSLIFKQHSK